MKQCMGCIDGEEYPGAPVHHTCGRPDQLEQPMFGGTVKSKPKSPAAGSGHVRRGRPPTWSEWRAGLIRKMTGVYPAAEVLEMAFNAIKVDAENAVTAWRSGISVAHYMELHGLTRSTWNGMAPCGIHGADYEGQQCSICPRKVVRLFDVETEKCTPLGQQISMVMRQVVTELLKRLQDEEPNASLRDFEMLFVEIVRGQAARGNVVRRRP